MQREKQCGINPKGLPKNKHNVMSVILPRLNGVGATELCRFHAASDGIPRNTYIILYLLFFLAPKRYASPSLGARNEGVMAQILARSDSISG